MRLFPDSLTKLPVSRALKELRIFLILGYIAALIALLVNVHFAPVAVILSVRPIAISMMHPGLKELSSGSGYVLASIFLGVISLLELSLYLYFF